jgi:hypothetical protein
VTLGGGGYLLESDLNGDGQLSRTEFRELWSGFWRGDDPKSPSQWVFGPY